MITLGNKTWKKVLFEDVFPDRKRDRIIGFTFPRQDINLGLEPSILSVLPKGNNVEYCLDNRDFNDADVKYYLCSVYITGYEEFVNWALKHNKEKIIVGGYQPTTFPEEFTRYASKIVVGPCDDFYVTIKQEGQIVNGILSFKEIPRYDLYDVKLNQQIIPDKRRDDICTSIWTSEGCPFKCDFCCTPMMSPKVVSKPLKMVENEVDYLKTIKPKWLFIRDENFPLQPDWKKRLELINKTGAKIYLFASANLLNDDIVKYMASQNVYMVCLGLEDVLKSYDKNKNLDAAVGLLKKYGIYTYLSFIVDPLMIIGQDKGKAFYRKLMTRFYDLAPEMVCGNFLMPFRGTKIWDQYYAFVSRDDYKYYDSKTAFLIKNPIVREKMQFFMFWYQWQYYTSDFYNKKVRKFAVNDMLHQRFLELYNEFRPKYEHFWNVRP